MSNVARIPLPESALDQRLVAVVRADSTEACLTLLDALVEADLRTIELTLTTPGAYEALSIARDRYGAATTLGMGTVLSVADARASLDAGAEFIVTPGVVLDALELGRVASVPVICGALTPTEVMTAWAAGASAVKLFPASLVSTSYVRELRGPFPDVLTMPSGGVGLGDVRAWLEAGCSAVSLGSALTRGSRDDVVERARSLVRDARATRADP